ncbi:MAG: CorA family divalent cation transporter [Candidatus Woesearchaeota archaeon]
MIDKTEVAFLLGGYDLEMIEIKSILNDYMKSDKTDFNITVYDKKLTWGAKLSDYHKELELFKDSIIYGIELIEDVKPPKNYHAIDHHNEKSVYPSSLEQIANLLKINLTRQQLLIAANDKWYIPGMEAMCATSDEINLIRKRDREIQGVTEDDEKKAVKSINENLVVLNGVYIIKSLTNKFSAIVDRMYNKTDKLLIYNNSELCYYGTYKKKIVDYFSNEIKNNLAYHGGGDNGYFGLAAGSFTEEQIVKIKDKILEIIGNEMQNNLIYSYHIFMFPFRWDFLPKGKGTDEINKIDFNDRTSLENFNKIFKKNQGIENKGSFKFVKSSDYNEYTYFYDFVRNAIYDEHEPTDIKNSNIFSHYTFNLGKNAKYCINILDDREYELNIDGIFIHIFNTGVGILNFRLKNTRYSQFEEILKINEYGRRLYPQFLSEDIDNNRIRATKKTFLACQLEIKTDNEKIGDIVEDFTEYNCEDIDTLRTKPKYISKIITRLLGNNFIRSHENETRIEDKILLRELVDDRMFVMCWYNNDKLANNLRKIITNGPNGIKNEYKFNISNDWYSYIFIDNDSNTPQCKNFQMMRDLLKKHTYPRFSDSGTLYGLSRYSFMCLTDSSSFSKDIISNHFKTIYYQLVVLCLIQRGSILRFSHEVTQISKAISKKISKRNNNQNSQDILSKIEQITNEYINFVNNIYFREVTAQEQGIELYDMLQNFMRIERDIKDLNREIDELYNYANLVEEKQQSNRLERLSILGAALLIPTLITSFLGMNIFNGDSFKALPNWSYWLFLVLMILASVFAGITFTIGSFHTLSFKKIKSQKRKFLIFIVISIILFIFVVAICFK